MFGVAVSFCSPCWQAVRCVPSVGLRVHCSHIPDTPWDEPTRGSTEYMQYITGEAFNHRPWKRFSADALCTSTASVCASEMSPNKRAALITGMLDIDPSHRMTLSDVAGHRWVTK